MHAECTNFDMVMLLRVLVAEAVFAFLYNLWVAKHQAKNDGVYTAFYVAGGVLVTVSLMALVIGLHAAALVLVGFVASGLPMILASMHRHTTRIESANQATIAGVRELLADGTQTED